MCDSYGISPAQLLPQLRDKHEELEDKDQLITQLILQNDTLMSRLDTLKSQLHTSQPTTTTTSDPPHHTPQSHYSNGRNDTDHGVAHNADNDDDDCDGDKGLIVKWWPIVLAVATVVVMALIKRR